MKRLKAIIKVEMKPALLVGVFFLLANILGFAQIQSWMNYKWQDYLQGGIGGYIYLGDWVDVVGNNMFNTTMIVSALYMLLLIVLVFASFRHERSVEVSRFLKSLPYTQKERCFVKVIIGVGTLTLGMLTYLVGLIAYRSYGMNKFTEIIEITGLASIEGGIFNLGKILQMVSLAYVVLIAAYLFLVLVQYVVNNRIGGVIIAVLSAIAPIYIVLMVGELFGLSGVSVWRTFESWFIYMTVELIGWAPIEMTTATYGGYGCYISGYGIHVVFYGVIAVATLTSLWYFAARYQLEESDLLMPHSIIRGIFIGGVSLCGGLTISGLMRIIWVDVFMLNNQSPNILTFIIGFIISFMISRKIAHIGMKKRKEVTR